MPPDIGLISDDIPQPSSQSFVSGPLHDLLAREEESHPAASPRHAELTTESFEARKV